MTSELHGVKLHQHRRNVSVPRHKRRSSLQLCVLYFTLNQPSVRWHMREREHAHSATHVSSCLLIIPLYFHCIFILWLSLRTISAITSRGEKLSQGGGSTVAPRLPERGERREGREGGKEGRKQRCLQWIKSLEPSTHCSGNIISFNISFWQWEEQKLAQ